MTKLGYLAAKLRLYTVIAADSSVPKSLFEKAGGGQTACEIWRKLPALPCAKIWLLGFRTFSIVQADKILRLWLL